MRIWFSPKSRKVRCCIHRPVELNTPNGVQQKKSTASPSSEDLAVFNFSSSSQESGPSTPPRAKMNKKTKKKRIGQNSRQAKAAQRPRTWIRSLQERKKLKLEVINKQWNTGEEADVDAIDETGEEDEKMSSGDDNKKPAKRVFFRLPPSQSEETFKPSQQRNLTPNHEKIVEFKDSEQQNSAALSLPDHDQQPIAEISPELNENELLQPSFSRVRKRSSSESLPKQPRITPEPKRRSSGEGAAFIEDSSQSLKTFRPTNEKPVLSSLGTHDVLKKAPDVRHKQTCPVYMKRNHKGETALHLAASKGDVEGVRKLLAQGADPNLKDNAGWTPLHEACNVGHLGVVEELLQQGALLNTPGYQNDSPLHDAIRSGHIAVVKLLVERGASQSVLNIFGLRPVDYALTPEMKEVLRVAPEASHLITTSLRPPASKAAGGVVLIGSELTQTQHKQINSAAQLLGGKQAKAFSSAVTHVVVPDVPIMPSTLTTLHGVLSGCWILNFSWLSCSLQAGSWVKESGYEAGDGPLRARANRGSLLPPLFDGCFFYMLGSFRKPPKDELLQLVKAGGGQLLKRLPKPDSDVTQTLNAAAYHAQAGSDQVLCTQYILYDPQSSYKPQKVRLGKVWSAPSTWLLDCIAAFRLLPVPEP